MDKLEGREKGICCRQKRKGKRRRNEEDGRKGRDGGSEGNRKEKGGRYEKLWKAGRTECDGGGR